MTEKLFTGTLNIKKKKKKKKKTLTLTYVNAFMVKATLDDVRAPTHQEAVVRFDLPVCQRFFRGHLSTIFCD